LNQPARLDDSDIIALGFAVVAVIFLSSSFFRRDLYELSPALYWAFDVLKFVVVPAAAALFLAKYLAIRPKHYGLRGIAQHETWGHFFGLTIFLALILDFAYYASWYIAWFALQPEVGPLFYQEINPRGLLRVPVTLYMAISAGVVEEIFFRGLPLLYLERRFPNALPRKSYILGTAALFGLIHWGNGPHEVMATFVFGVLAAILYLRLRDLWPLIVAHAAIDIHEFA
jgi:membrane protease YdiL (CAAX protease family)